jgi:hypothetical protein
MTYTADIARTNPTAFLFVVDQSASMDERLESGQTKAEFVADVLNKTLYQLVIRCTRSEGVRNYFDVGVIGYGGKGVYSAFGAALASEFVHPLAAIEQSPLRVETPHQFRHHAGRVLQRHSPGAFAAIAALLGHKDVQTAMRYYAELDTLSAGRHFDEILETERSEARLPARRRS